MPTEAPAKLRTAALSLTIRVAGFVACLYVSLTEASGWALAAVVAVDIWAAFTVLLASLGMYILVRDRRGLRSD